MRVRGGRFARRQKRQVVNWWAQEEDAWAQSELRAALWRGRSQAVRTTRNARRRWTGSRRPLIVCFVVTRQATWHLDHLYRLLDTSPYFEPYFLVSRLKEDTIGTVFNNCMAFAREQSYRQAPVDPSLGGRVSSDWLKKVDAIFYDIPYEEMHADQRLTSGNFPYAYVGYLPYGVRHVTVQYVDWTSPLVRRCDRYYCETDWHRGYNIDRAPQVGRRSIVTGYPSTYRILQNSRGRREIALRSGQWAMPRVPVALWAPHWTWATSPAGAWRFVSYHRLLCKMAREGRIKLWYRPHPLLDGRLKELATPAQFRADEFAFLPGTPYRDGVDMDYVDLFAEVDLIVHNSGSFLSEFIATGKPSVFITEESFIETNVNEFGRRALDASYQVATEKQLQQALESLIAGDDRLVKERLDFASYLDGEMPVDPSEVIAADLARAFSARGELPG